MKLLSNSATAEIEVGSYVIVLRKADSHENGWDNSWCAEEMGRMVGETLKVEAIRDGEFCRQMRLNDDYEYPEFILKLV